MSRIYQLTASGWNDAANTTELKPFYNRRLELSVHQGCILWGGRVIIPLKLRQHILEQLHETHSGVVKMKHLARSYVWWPGIDQEIEQITKKCPGCLATQNEPATAPLHPWDWPCKPWQRIHVDFCGPFLGHMFLVIVDAHSKWPEVICMTSTTSERTIEVLRETFSRYGLCEHLVSDNGPQFTSDEFRLFMQNNGILHTKSVPYHAASNGQAERMVQSLKHALKSAQRDAGTLKLKLAQFLLTYRNTPHSTTHETPAQLFLGRPLRTKLDLVKPSVQSTVQTSQYRAMMSCPNKTLREFAEGQTVAVRDYRGKDRWVSATVVKRNGPLTYEVKTQTATPLLWRRHVDQMRAALTQSPAAQTSTYVDQDAAIPEARIATADRQTTPSSTVETESETEAAPSESDDNSDTTLDYSLTAAAAVSPKQSNTYRRYPLRDRKPPDRLIEHV